MYLHNILILSSILVSILLWLCFFFFCTVVSYSMFGIAAIFDCFNLYLAMDFDCTPAVTVATLLLQSLQRIPDVAESRSRQLIPLFLNFMGYDDSSIFRYLDAKLSYTISSFGSSILFCTFS
jgi:hypothetical protein